MRNKNLKDPISIREAASKNYVDNKFEDAIIIKNTAHVDFNDKNIDNDRFIKVNSVLAAPEHLTAKYYVEEAIYNSVDESSLIGLDLDEKLKLDEQDSKILNSTVTSPKTIIELTTKSVVDSLKENNKKRRDLSSLFDNQDNEFDKNKLTKLDSITVNREPSSDDELANKKHVADSIGKGNVFRCNQTLQNYL